MGCCEEGHIKTHIERYIRTRFFPDVHRAWPDTHFDVEMDQNSLKSILERAGIRPPAHILHTHTTSPHYKELLERMGFDVHAFDLSLPQAVRSGAKILNAERVFEFQRGKYDGALVWEPAEFFHGSGTIFGSAALLHSLLRAVKPRKPVIVLATDYVTGGGPADNFEAVLHWAEKHFGVHVERLRREGKDPLAHYVLDVRSGQRARVAAFKITADGDALQRLYAFVHRFDSLAARHVRKTASAPALEDISDRIYRDLRQLRVPTVGGHKTMLDVVKDYLHLYNRYMKTF